MSEEPETYIVTRIQSADCYNKKQLSKTFKLGDIVHHFDEMNDVLLLVKCENKEDENVWIMSKNDLFAFDKSFEEYLLPVHPLKDRLRILEDVELCERLKDLREKDYVYVLPGNLNYVGSKLRTKKLAILKYKGPIPELEPGIHFGVELLSPEDGDVNLDIIGYCGFEHLFSCRPYSGLILTANNIEPKFPKTWASTSNHNLGGESDGRLPFKVGCATMQEQRAKLERMPQSSYLESRLVDHTDHFDACKQKKTGSSPSPYVSRTSEDFSCSGKAKQFHQRSDMDKSVLQPISRPDKLFTSSSREGKQRDVYNMTSDYKNGISTSPYDNEQRCLSSDHFYQKEKKNEVFAEFPSSHSSCNYTQSGKTTPVNKLNGTNPMSSAQSDTVDGCKIKNTSRMNCSDRQYSTTYRDDYGPYKPSKVTNSSVSSNLSSPGYSSSIHSVQSDPDLHRLSNVVDHNLYHRDGDLSSASPESSSEFEVGSLVEVEYYGKSRFGVIRWIGISDKNGKKPYVGIETEEELENEAHATDGNFSGKQYFTCQRRRGIFVNMNKCKKDSRFQENSPGTGSAAKACGFAECPKIEGTIRPIMIHSKDLHKICGKGKGIQGNHNSCYLDATLFSMFTFTSVFDSLLYRPREGKDTPQYNEVQSVLRDEIVNPLRVNMFVRADKVMKLRTLLEKHSSVSGLTSEEKDPEEFLNSLVAQMLRAEPFLKLSSGQEAYYYQLFVEKKDRPEIPTVQNLFEESFLASDIKLSEVPSCLIIQMPRFGKSFKMYPRILPSQLLDVTDVIDDSPRQCCVCGKLATFECKACLKPEGLESISYCEGCLDTVHCHPECMNKRHECKELATPYLFDEIPDTTIPRLYMELFAVVCIETSHYVTFVKCGDGPDAPWCFFDSMADRSGEQNGFNIPEVIAMPDLPSWISSEGAQKLQQYKDRELPEHAKRLLCDAYMCMYRSPDIQMYR